MFSRISHLTLSLLALGLISCHSQGQSGADRLNDRPEVPEYQDGRYGWEGITHSCSQLDGARFREFKKECECASLQNREEIPELFSMDPGAACMPLNYSQSCTGDEAMRRALVDEGLPGLNACLRDIAQMGRTHLSVEVAGLSEREALAVARYFDLNRGRFFAKLWPTREEDYFNATVTVVVGKKKIDRDYIQSVLAPPSRGERKPFRATYFEPDAQNFYSALGHPLDVPKGLEATPAPLSQRFPVAGYLQEIAGRILNENLSQFQGDTLGDCRRHCVLRHRFFSDASGRYQAVREKSYVGGVPYRDIVWVDELATKTRLVALHLNPRGGVSALLFLTPQRDMARDEVGTWVEVYDRKWNLLGAEWFTWISRYAEVAEELTRLPQTSAAVPEGIVLCENVNLGLVNGLGVYLSAGQISGPGEGESLLGWVTRSASWERFLDPLLELSGGGIPNLGSMGHGQGVAEVILASHRSAKLIPISFSACLERFYDWAPRVEQKGIKVVQLAGAATWDERACRASYPLERMIENQTSFLWVMAAGNSGARNPRNRCPQSAIRSGNTLVVAAGQGNSLWSESDYGTGYADVAAPYQWNGSSGTSYASPRVAAIAAKIAESYPALSARSLRALILFSVDVPWQPLDVRSGGQLNGVRALELARQWKRSGVTESKLYDHEFLAALLEENLENPEVERRIGIWRRNGLLGAR